MRTWAVSWNIPPRSWAWPRSNSCCCRNSPHACMTSERCEDVMTFSASSRKPKFIVKMPISRHVFLIFVVWVNTIFYLKLVSWHYSNENEMIYLFILTLVSHNVCSVSFCTLCPLFDLLSILLPNSLSLKEFVFSTGRFIGLQKACKERGQVFSSSLIC